jgi:hypothetical protein
MIVFRVLMSIFVLLISVSFSEESFTDGQIASNPGVELTIGGMVAMENGQFINGYFNQQLMVDRPWLYRGIGQIHLHARMNDHLSITLSPEIRIWFDSYGWQTWANEALNHPFTQRSTVSFAEAQGTVTVGDTESNALSFSGGVMPYKYSPSKNLGEYLFRSGARPTFVYTDFDFAFSRLAGVRIGTRVIRNFTADVLLSTETRVLPNLDWSLSGLVDYSLPNVFDAGAGIMFDRLFPTSKSANQPADPINNQYLTIDKEKKYFSFGGTKLMGHLSFDPKCFFSESMRENVFGQEDLKLYGEIAVLGLKNIAPYKYPLDTSTGREDTTRVVFDSSKAYYNDITQRIPIMVGITIPTFKTVEYLSVEVEYFPWPYSNSMGKTGFQIPVPQPVGAKNVPLDVYKQDNVKYSVNVKKTIFNSLSLIGQVARDNSRVEVYDPSKYAQNFGECVFLKDNGWGWWLKVQYTF